MKGFSLRTFSGKKHFRIACTSARNSDVMCPGTGTPGDWADIHCNSTDPCVEAFSVTTKPCFDIASAEGTSLVAAATLTSVASSNGQSSRSQVTNRRVMLPSTFCTPLSSTSPCVLSRRILMLHASVAVPKIDYQSVKQQENCGTIF